MKIAGDDRALRVEEVAIRLGVKPATVRAMILRRRISYLKIGRSVRVLLSTVDEILSDSIRPARGVPR